MIGSRVADVHCIIGVVSNVSSIIIVIENLRYYKLKAGILCLRII